MEPFLVVLDLLQEENKRGALASYLLQLGENEGSSCDLEEEETAAAHNCGLDGAAGR